MDRNFVYRRSFFILFFLALVVLSSAQSVDISFKRINSTSDQLLGSVLSITQDKHGFIWFADKQYNNVIRYDGHTMKVYSIDEIDPVKGGLETIVADSMGTIWIGTYGNGLIHLDPISGKKIHYSHKNEDPSSLSNNIISSLLIDHSGKLWIGSDGGLDLFDQKTETFINYSHDPNDPASLSHNKVRIVYEDHNGVLWAGTGFPWDPGDKGGLNRFDRKSGKFTRYLRDPNDPETIINNKVSALFEDSQGNFWVGTVGDGLHSLDRNSGKFTRHTYDPENPEKLSRPPTAHYSDHIRFIIEDVQKNIWIGTSLNGVNRYDLKTGNLQHFMDGNEIREKPPHFPPGHINNIMEPGITRSWFMYSSDDGTLFLADLSYSSPRLFRINLFDNRFPFESMGILSFYEDTEYVHWFGTQDGLIRKDLRNKSIKEFVNDPSDSSSIIYNRINSVIKDDSGTLWIGAISALGRFDPVKEVFSHYVSDNEVSTNTLQISASISTLYLDNAGFLWIGGKSGTLDRFNRNTGTFDHYFGFEASIDLHVGKIYTMVDIEKSNLLIATEIGLLKLNPQNREIRVFLENINVNDIYKVDEDLLWIATTTGVYRFEPKSESLTRININTEAYSIEGDQSGSLWIGSPIGLINLDIRGNIICIYSEARGIQTKEPLDIARRLTDGKLLFGGKGGYYVFDPKKLINLPFRNKLLLTEFNIIGQEENLSNLLLQDSNEPDINRINLNHDENTFSMVLSELDLYDLGDPVSYKLDRYDESWRQVQSGENNYLYQGSTWGLSVHSKSSKQYGWEMGRIYYPYSYISSLVVNMVVKSVIC